MALSLLLIVNFLLLFEALKGMKGILRIYLILFIFTSSHVLYVRSSLMYRAGKSSGRDVHVGG